jgi:hypothetical protein
MLPEANFGFLLRHWRSVRRVSQLDLAGGSTRRFACFPRSLPWARRSTLYCKNSALKVFSLPMKPRALY